MLYAELCLTLSAEHCDNISDCSFNILHEPEEDNPFGFLEM